MNHFKLFGLCCIGIALSFINIQAQTPCSGGSAGGYPCDNVDLIGYMSLGDMGCNEANDIWGWTDPVTGKEYAIFGCTDRTTFIDISTPTNPVFIGQLISHNNSSSIWRDMKVYADHAFIVSEAGGHGMQVFDLTQLRNVSSPPVSFSETAFYNNLGNGVTLSNSHNIVINEQSGFAYTVGSNTCSGGLTTIDISNPTNPVFAGCFEQDGYTHDAQCVSYIGPDGTYAGKEICFNSNENTLTIVDVDDKTDMTQISRTGYTGSRYAHQGWLTDDHEYFLMNDELDESNNGHNTRTYIWDVRDLDNPVFLGYYEAAVGAIDHNLYIKGDRAYLANYRSGLRILDISDVSNANLTEVGYFDTYPSSNSSQFNSAWSSYPYFASENIIISDIEQGLFIVKFNTSPTCNDGILNGNETDVDCGGPDCPTCPPTCFDGIQNGDETGVDCGGSTCSACVPTCTDGLQNGDETGVDCGGSNCPACPPTCTDGVQNGNETAIDCGGPDCPACPTCNDGILNGNETAIDCGGSDCPACPSEDCTPYDFANITVESYDSPSLGTGNGNDFGTYTVQDNGATLYMTGNAWKAIEVNYTVTPNTVLQFDFRSTVPGEIHEVSFGDGLDFNLAQRLFLYFNQQGVGNNYNIQTYTGSGNWEAFTIPIGSFFTGTFQYMVLTADDDANAVADSYFRNMVIYEDYNNNLMCDDSCPAIISLTNPPVNGLYHAGLEVNCNTTVDPSSNTTFKARDIIKLESGFNTPTSTNFEASIEACQ